MFLFHRMKKSPSSIKMTAPTTKARWRWLYIINFLWGSLKNKFHFAIIIIIVGVTGLCFYRLDIKREIERVWNKGVTIIIGPLIMAFYSCMFWRRGASSSSWLIWHLSAPDLERTLTLALLLSPGWCDGWLESCSLDLHDLLLTRRMILSFT